MLSDSEAFLFRVIREILHFVQNDMLGKYPFSAPLSPLSPMNQDNSNYFSDRMFVLFFRMRMKKKRIMVTTNKTHQNRSIFK